MDGCNLQANNLNAKFLWTTYQGAVGDKKLIG
jgi:hypothetical protein